MCGIAGFTGPANPALLRRMTDRIGHRGPDADGFYSDPDNGVNLGHRRLSILDHAGGAQPMHSAAGDAVIVFNGEIYNFRELRTELVALGAHFHSDHSDTEVLLQAWRHWGPHMTARLNGMWAFVIHDRRQRLLFASRDRFGKKPLFWAHAQGQFVFASELTAMREHPLINGGVDPLALRKYFAYGYVPAPRSLLAGVNKLPAGHSLQLDLSCEKLTTSRYWHYQPEPDPSITEAMAREQLHTLLDAAVARRMVADVAVGCFLSGGLDSSLIAALATRHAGSDRLRAYSIGFNEADFDESPYAAEVARHLGIDHHIETVPVARALAALGEINGRWDEPIADSSLLPTWLLCQYARHDVTVALGGDGADELFAGYDPFKALGYARLADRWLPKPLHRALSLLAAKLPVSHGYMSFEFRLKRLLRGLSHRPALRLPVWMAPLTAAELGELFDEPVDLETLYSEAIEAWDENPQADEIERAIQFYIRLYLQDDILVKVDRASMLHSLEVRAPFLDADVADFARRLPARMKFAHGQGKWVVRQVAAGLLPERVLTRRKQGFALPVGQWFAEGTLGQPGDVSGARADFWQHALAQHRRGDVDNRLYLWAETALAASPLDASPLIHDTAPP
ncbi:MAG TPA: asparagine synthase (glutamine-hydrolyzing) [Rhodanobacteraceae bacterium]|nr:asparagine synthase (glutamine-hydrolyzing) [Rhodanobacteraceae bacterium]